MRISRLIVFQVLLAASIVGQQIPFVRVTGANAPTGPDLLMEDKVRGGLWLGGILENREGLTYFDGSRFISPFDDFPKVSISCMAEDSEGGLWLAANNGLYRAFQRHLERVAEGYAAGLVQAAPQVLVATVTKAGAESAELLRVVKESGRWKAETIIPSIPQVRLQADDAGNILYECPDGYCEFRAVDVVSWRPGSPLARTRHHAAHPPSASQIDADSVRRDRFGCVWLRSGQNSVYQCPGDKQARSLRENIASTGATSISELEDGSVIIPSFGELAIGRPGHFRVVTALNGYPGAINVVATTDGSLWFSNGNGLFVFPKRLRMEFWTERDGLNGNTWAILRTSSKTLALAGEAVRVLDQDRSRWSLLPMGRAIDRLLPAPQDTVLAGSLTAGFRISGKGRVVGKAHLSVEQLGPSDIQADRHGDLWTCYDGGLLHMTAEGHRITTSDRLRKENCLYLALDREGNIWYSNRDLEAAFTLLENPGGSQPRILKFRSGGEVGVASVRFLGVDSRGWIWRGSPVGVYVADPQQARQGEWLFLNRLDGIGGTDANRRSFFSDPDGSVWFGLDNSINHLYPPADFLHPNYSPAVFVSGFSWNNDVFQMADLVDEIEHGSNIVAHIGSLQFDRRNSLRLRYRLLPDQASWKTDSDLDIGLGKLSWGKHTLEVQARLFTGPWSSTVSKSFTVLKPVWLSWPVLLGFAFAGGIAAAGGESWRRRRKHRSKTKLPALADWRLAVLSPEAPSLQGAVLDRRFEIGRILARGGFATVFLGRDLLQQNQACAVKIFRHELLEKSWRGRRFQQEVSALTQIQHPNVVRIYGYGEAANGAPYLAMEFIDGVTLRDLLKEGRLERPRAASYLRQIGNALARIHARGICHRDLKPENLMVRRMPSPSADLVLIDFSIAIVQDPDETLHGLSRAAGTLQYMAPEQAIGYADASSDIYSLAKILMEMLTGERLSSLLPDASMDLPVRIREFLTQSALGLSPDSIDLISAALEFDPSRRPKNAHEFAVRIGADLGP